ncbi:MAG: mono/diheme cytochrome c family protein, partial [Myxococcota bacterium]
YLSEAWIRRFLVAPSHPKHFGNTKLKEDDEGNGMPATEVEADELKALVAFVASRGGADGLDAAQVAAGATFFEDGDCSSCHNLDQSEGQGPDLTDYGSAKWLGRMLQNPAHELMYGELGDGMPAFDHLSEDETDYLVGWLLHLKQETQIRE